MNGYAVTLKDIYGTIENMEAAIAERKADEARDRDWAYLESLSQMDREIVLENRSSDAYEERLHIEWCESGEALRHFPALPYNDCKYDRHLETSPVVVRYLKADGSVEYYPDHDSYDYKTVVTVKADLVSHPQPWSWWTNKLCPF